MLDSLRVPLHCMAFRSWRRSLQAEATGRGMQARDASEDAEVIAMLRRHPGFASLGEATLGAISARAPVDATAAPQLLFSQGSLGTFAYLILEGELAIEVDSEQGPITVARLGPGQLVGEVAAFAATARTASVRTLGPARLLRIEQATIRDHLAHRPDAASAIIAELGQRLQSLNGTIATLTRATNALARGEFLPEMLDDLRQQADRFAHFADVFDAMAREIQEKRMRGAEMRTAAEIQRSFLPAPIPAAAGPGPGLFDVAALMIPAREVGGDFFDYFMLGPDELGIAVGDVSGKGVPAAMFMGVARTVLKTIAREGGSAATVLERVNAVLSEDNAESMFVTIAYGRLSLSTGALDLALGGHEEVFVLDGGAVAKLDPTGPAVGLFPGARFGARELRLSPGAAVVLATDGVTEAFDARGACFGLAATEATLATLMDGAADAETIVAGLAQAVARFAGGHPQSDDLTCLALRWPGGQAGAGPRARQTPA